MAEPYNEAEQCQLEQQMAQRRADEAEAQARPTAGSRTEPSTERMAAEAGMSEDRFRRLSGRTRLAEWEAANAAERGS